MDPDEYFSGRLFDPRGDLSEFGISDLMYRLGRDAPPEYQRQLWWILVAVEPIIEAAVIEFLTYLIAAFGMLWVMTHLTDVNAMILDSVRGAALISNKIAEIVSRYLSENRDTPDADRIRGIVDKLPKGSAKNPKKDNREVPTDEAMQRLFDEISEGGETVRVGNYPGRQVRMPDGTLVQMREDSSSGGRTIDINYPDGFEQKIHLPKK
ncbi:hypothetical protein [Gordonia sp. (in: high G+C Gram-positive bacteria)]|uniref:hypothetical protein n=1 Tax=unclassified Gordonia (in: high G+C Gram-positive bacteria) TaxID=2657482 RepID=UPI003528B540